MGNPSKNPYSKSDSISYMVRDLPPGGRDQNNFSPFRLFRGNGSWCRISRIQSPSHHIISELKSSPPKPSEVSSKIFLPVIRKKPGCGRPVLPSASFEALGQEESSNPQRISKKMGDLGSGEDGISPIPCGSGMENGKTWPRPSYRICWRRRVAIRKGFRKKWAIWESGEDGISPIPCGSGMENGKTWPRPSYRICWRRRVAIRKGFRK